MLVGSDGRARVVDFGLARTLGTGEGPGLDGQGREAVRAPLVDSLTRTGVMVGTPRYMSPEQFECRPATPRSDQFSLCVALWEALYGRPPFTGGSLALLASNITAGQREAPPPGADVPASIHAIVVRGLAVDPSARWPSIDALLAALATDPEFAGDPELDLRIARRPRLLLGLGLSAVAILNAGVIIVLVNRRERPATTGDVLFEGVLGVAITCALVFVARRHILKNAINRRIVFFGLVVTIAPLINRYIGHRSSAPLAHILTTDMLLAVALCALAGAVLVRWLWYVGAVFLAGLIVGILLPGQIETILAVSQCAAWIVGVRLLLGEGSVGTADGFLRPRSSSSKGLRSSLPSSRR